MSTNRTLINRAAVREFTMATLAETRPHLAGKFTRVSREYLERIEGFTRYSIQKYLAVMPTSGRTLR